MSQQWPGTPVAQTGAGTGPQPVLSVPDTGKEQDRDRAERGDQRDEERLGMAQEADARGQTETRFRQEKDLRDGFDKNPEVVGYRSSLPMLTQALRAPKNGQGDISVIYAYAKLMDPTSVVRESEMDMVTGSSPWAQAKAQELQNQLDSSGRLPPNVRRSLEQEMIRTTRARRLAYDAQRERYMQNAQAYGLDPMLVVGPHAGDAFRDDMLAFDEERGLGRFANQQQNTTAPPVGGTGPGGTVNPAMRGGLPVGTQITFDGPDGPQWWDRNQWLMETRGITPDQENQIVGFWNANRGNQGITPEGVYAWYDSMGIPRPSEQEVMQGVQYARAGTVEFGAFDDSDAKAARAAQLQGMVQQDEAVRNFGAEYDPNSARSYLDTLTEAPLAGFADELSGLSGAIVGGLSGENPVTAYRDARDASQFRDEMNRNAQGIPGEALRIVGSLPTAMSLPGAYSPTVGGAVKAGASYGALAGAGEGRGLEGTIKGAAGGAALGGAVGGATAGAGQWAVNKLAARSAARGPTMTAAERYQRGQQFGIDLSLGDAGGMSAKAVERGLDYQPVSASIMDEARNVKAAQIETAVGNVADTFGRPTTLRGIGETAQRGAKNWMVESEKAVSKLYEAIPIAPEASAATPNTVTRLTELTSKFSSNPRLSGMLEDKRLSGYLEALTAKARQVPTGLLDDAGNPITREVTEGGELSWQDLKDLRSRIGEEIGQQMFGEKTLKSDLRSLYGALSSDMEATAARQGQGALKAFKRANTQAKNRFDRIEAVVEPLLGKAGDNTPDAAASLIQRISQGGKSTTDLKMLAQVRKTLKPDEWGQVQNGLVRIMGQPAKSGGRNFAPETFVRVYGDLDKGAKNIMFGTGDLRKNLDEFVEVVSDVARNDGTRNTSRTANGVVGALTLSPAFYTGGLPGVMAQTAMSFATAKVMTNPAAVRWLTGYSKMIRAAGKSGTINPKAHAGQLAALGRLASAHPSVAQEATALQRELQGLFAGSGSRAAAEGDNRPKAKPTTMPVPK